MRNAYEIVLIRALRYGVNPAGAGRSVPDELVRLAEGNRSVLERALLRVDHALEDRRSAVGERARQALCDALHTCPGAPARAS